MNKNEITRVVIDFEDQQNYVRLFHAFEACSNLFTHESDNITYQRSDGFTLRINTSTHYVQFGNKDDDRKDWAWNDNVDTGQLKMLVVMFMRGSTAQIIISKIEWASTGKYSEV